MRAAWALAVCLLAGCRSEPAPSPSAFQKQLQERLIRVAPGDTIDIPAGSFELTRTLTLAGKQGVTLRGAGLDQTVLSFKGQTCLSRSPVRAHCHEPDGPAAASGLSLRFEDPEDGALGVCKRPVAAGRGSGGLDHDIVPGRPEASILFHRMASREPDVMMPELGRNLRDEEGLALVRDWIASLPGTCS